MAFFRDAELAFRGLRAKRKSCTFRPSLVALGSASVGASFDRSDFLQHATVAITFQFLVARFFFTMFLFLFFVFAFSVFPSPFSFALFFVISSAFSFARFFVISSVLAFALFF